MLPNEGGGWASTTKYFALRSKNEVTEDLTRRWARGPANFVVVRYHIDKLPSRDVLEPRRLPYSLDSRRFINFSRCMLLPLVCRPSYVATRVLSRWGCCSAPRRVSTAFVSLVYPRGRDDVSLPPPMQTSVCDPGLPTCISYSFSLTCLTVVSM